jgi:hypothetical protein
MGSALSFEYKEAIRHLQLILESVSHKKILLLRIDIAKSPRRINLENNLSVSPTYKKYNTSD